MNRIYQGHVTKVEIPDAKDGDGKPRWKEMPKWQDALWEHHKLFQDAVNYYIVALAALADPKHATSRLIKDFRARVSAHGRNFPDLLETMLVAFGDQSRTGYGFPTKHRLRMRSRRF